MTVVFSSGYTLPAGDLPLTHSRLAHRGNWLKGGVASATSTDAAFFVDGPVDTLTYEKWKPTTLAANWVYDVSASSEVSTVTNLADNSEALDLWSLGNVTVTADAATAPDGAVTADTVIPTVASTFHLARCSPADVTLGQQYVLSVYAQAAGYDWIRISGEEAGFSAVDYALFNVAAGTVGTTQTGVDAAGIEDVGGGWFRCWIVLTAVATDAARLAVYVYNSDSIATFAGDGVSGVNLWGGMLHEGTEPLPYVQTGADVASIGYGVCDYCAIGAHTLGTNAVQLRVQRHDGAAWLDTTQLFTPADDSPLFIIFPPVAGALWRLRMLNGDGLPEVGTVKFGRALQMQRSLYGNYTPPQFARNTSYRSTISQKGEFLGRTVERSTLEADIQWPMVTRDWADANWLPAVKAIEQDAFFIAPMPNQRQDVIFGEMRRSPNPYQEAPSGFAAVGLEYRAYAHD